MRFTALHSAVRVSLCVSLRFTAPRVFHCSPESAVASFQSATAIRSSSGPVNLQRVCENHPSLERKACKRLTTSLLAQHYETLLRDGLRCRCLIITSNSNSVFSSRASCQNQAHQLGPPQYPDSIPRKPRENNESKSSREGSSLTRKTKPATRQSKETAFTGTRGYGCS